MMPSFVSPEAWASRLEAKFSQILIERMVDVPVINERLHVESAGFQEWNGHVLGVLVTPWFMNLLLLPGIEDDWSELKVGFKRSFAFEAGSFEFIMGEEQEIGKFMSCSMFSPMFEFESHDAAMVTANAIVEELFDQKNRESFTPQSLGEDKPEVDESPSLASEVLEGVEAAGEITRNRMDKPVTRRDLLRGRFLRKEHEVESQERR